jgi:CBS domain-containing protein
MNVARILREKGREVLIAKPDLSLAEAAAQLAARGVGAVVVSDDATRVLGILSERDIVRAVSSRGAGALGDAVSRHMTTEVTTVGEDATIEDAMAMMTKGRFRHLPVVENGRLVGIVSIGDVVKRHVEAIDGERRVLREYIASA